MDFQAPIVNGYLDVASGVGAPSPAEQQYLHKIRSVGPAPGPLTSWNFTQVPSSQTLAALLKLALCTLVQPGSK